MIPNCRGCWEDSQIAYYYTTSSPLFVANVGSPMPGEKGHYRVFLCDEDGELVVR